MRFQFSLRVTLICSLLILGMIRASVWQWQRHLGKQEYIAQMTNRLSIPISPLTELDVNSQTDWSSLIFRRVAVSGTYDFSKEIVLRNRRHAEIAGVFVITPLKLTNTEQYILVNRGFIPYDRATPELRRIFQRDRQTQFVGLIKEGSTSRFFLAPQDPEPGPDNPWIDAWLRVDIGKIAKQLPYPILNAYLEIMSTESPADAGQQIVKDSHGQEELLFLGMKTLPKETQEIDLAKYPVPVFDTVIPAGRHLGYVYEWAVMALVTFLIGTILQFRRPKRGSVALAINPKVTA